MIGNHVMNPTVARVILHMLEQTFPDKDPYYYQQGLCELYQCYIFAAPEYTAESAENFMSDLLEQCDDGIGDFWDNTIPFDQSDTVQFVSDLAGNYGKSWHSDAAGIAVRVYSDFRGKWKEIATARTLADAVIIGEAYRDDGNKVKLVRLSNDEDITRALDLPQEKFRR